jgi:hypothetical protein
MKGKLKMVCRGKVMKNNKNELKKKISVWKEFREVYKTHFLVILGILALLFVPFFIGKTVGPILVDLEIFYPFQPNFCSTWSTGFVILMLTVFLSIPIIIIICLIIDCIDNSRSNIKIIKNMVYLPITEDEFKTLNINSFEEFDEFILALFGTNRTHSLTIKDRLVSKFKECYTILPLPDDIIDSINEDINERYKNKFIELRGKALAYKITGNEISYNKCICELKDMQNDEKKRTEKSTKEE